MCLLFISHGNLSRGVVFSPESNPPSGYSRAPLSLPFLILVGTFPHQYVLKSPEYTKYSGLSITFFKIFLPKPPGPYQGRGYQCTSVPERLEIAFSTHLPNPLDTTPLKRHQAQVHRRPQSGLPGMNPKKNPWYGFVTIPRVFVLERGGWFCFPYQIPSRMPRIL